MEERLPALNDAAPFGPRLPATPPGWRAFALRLAREGRGALLAARGDSATSGATGGELGARTERILRAGFLVGWVALAVVLVGALTSTAPRQRAVLLALTAAAVVANAGWMRVPWREWLGRPLGKALLDLWSAGLLAYVAALVVVGGSKFALLLFLATPFLVVVHPGARRGLWLVASAGTCVLVTVVAGLPVSASAMRFGLVLATVGAALALEGALRRESAGRAEAAILAELEHARVIDAHHRVKNSLQTVADLLLLEQPDGVAGEAFEQSASRIRSIAALHDVLSATGDALVRVDELLELIIASDAGGIVLAAEPVLIDATAARRLALVANELITNARKHGELPISVRLERLEDTIRLSVRNAGAIRPPGSGSGLGLDLVRHLVEQGLRGELVLASPPRGGVLAQATF